KGAALVERNNLIGEEAASLRARIRADGVSQPVVMTRNPWELAAGELRAVQIPLADEEATRRIACRYHVTHVVAPAQKQLRPALPPMLEHLHARLLGRVAGQDAYAVADACPSDAR